MGGLSGHGGLSGASTAWWWIVGIEATIQGRWGPAAVSGGWPGVPSQRARGNLGTKLARDTNGAELQSNTCKEGSSVKPSGAVKLAQNCWWWPGISQQCSPSLCQYSANVD